MMEVMGDEEWVSRGESSGDTSVSEERRGLKGERGRGRGRGCCGSLAGGGGLRYPSRSSSVSSFSGEKARPRGAAPVDGTPSP
jgi:hypothetical protein